MTELVYFAYGSNMLRERLDARCPNVRPAGNAVLHEHRLTFDQFSHVDASGKGGIVPAPGSRVPGVLWILPVSDLPALDAAESAGRGYQRVSVPVTREQGDVCEVITYQPIDLRSGLKPWDWYLALVVAGAEQHELPDAYVQRLRETPSAADPEAERPGRLAALDALRRADAQMLDARSA